MVFRSLITLLLLTATLPAAARDAAPVQQNLISPQVIDICRSLTETTEAIETSLLKVKDRKSADEAAPHMRQLQQKVRTLLLQLEEAPGDLMTNREITRTMLAITHIAQRYIPIIAHLQAENAYGSEPLMTVLQVLGSDDPYGEAETDEPIPHNRREQINKEIARILNDVLYELRKTTDSYSARNAAATLRPVLTDLSELMSELATPATQSDTDLPASPETENTTLVELKSKLAEEITRLQQAAYFDDPDLPIMLGQYANLLN